MNIFPYTPEKATQAVLCQFGDSGSGEGQLDRNRVALCPLLEPLCSATLTLLVISTV
jgi:hypothetical protein